MKKVRSLLNINVARRGGAARSCNSVAIIFIAVSIRNVTTLDKGTRRVT